MIKIGKMTQKMLATKAITRQKHVLLRRLGHQKIIGIILLFQFFKF
jgi:hypothetical protein